MSTSPASTLHRIDPNYFGSAGAASFPVGEARFADAVITNVEVSWHTGQDFKESDFEFINAAARIHQRIPNFPLPQVKSKRRSFQETASWEGVVPKSMRRALLRSSAGAIRTFPQKRRRSLGKKLTRQTGKSPWKALPSVGRSVILKTTANG